jgi:hypothetical protein
VVNVKDFGAVGDGVADDRNKIISALNYAASANKKLYIPDGIYACSDWIPLPDKIKLEFSSAAQWKLTNSTALGGFVCGGYDINLNFVPFTDATITGINLDCNNIAGENGFNAVNANGVRVNNPQIYNTLFDPIKLGGRAFQFEGGIIESVVIQSPYIENCSIGINSQADANGGTEIARFISYFDVVMRNVDVPFNIDGQFANPELGIPTNMSTFVDGVNLYNCGKLTYSGSNPIGAGIICGDRGYGLKIENLRLLNSSAYGGIGGFVRGTLFGVQIENVKLEIPYTIALFNFTPVTFGSPSMASFASTINANNIIANLTNLDYVVKGNTAGTVGVCCFDNITINSAIATLTGICDLAATSGGLGYLNLILSDQSFESTGLQSLLDLYNSGNGIGSAQPDYSEGTWTPIDASGAGLTFTIPDTCRFVRNKRVVTANCKIVYPSTINAANAVIGGLPFTAANFSTMAGTGAIGYSTENTLNACYVLGNTTTSILTNSTGVAVINSTMSGDSINLTFTYFAA